LERTDIVTIDGSHGEGGGQILRTALSLSAITSRPFRIVSVRATRRKPGLQPQHLSATRAAAAITGATVVGDLLGSSELTFTPSHKPQAGSYLFDVAEFAGHGSAGSSILILQTILVPLALAPGPSNVVARGAPIRNGLPPSTISPIAICPLFAAWGLASVPIWRGGAGIRRAGEKWCAPRQVPLI
jgi:RNA 3'-terminal phosphate cyclase (ATP)